MHKLIRWFKIKLFGLKYTNLLTIVDQLEGYDAGRKENWSHLLHEDVWGYSCGLDKEEAFIQLGETYLNRTYNVMFGLEVRESNSTLVINHRGKSIVVIDFDNHDWDIILNILELTPPGKSI